MLALCALAGCGAHDRASVPPARVLADDITPVSSNTPEGKLTAAKYVSPPPSPPRSAEAAPRETSARFAAWPDSVPRPRYGDSVFVEVQPEPIVRGLPEYPDSARAAGVQGTILVEALVGIDGRVHEVMTLHSIPLLEAAAFTAARKFRYTPALAHGRPVAVWVEIPIKFTLH
jgi:protein TonB